MLWVKPKSWPEPKLNKAQVSGAKHFRSQTFRSQTFPEPSFLEPNLLEPNFLEQNRFGAKPFGAKPFWSQTFWSRTYWSQTFWSQAFWSQTFPEPNLSEPNICGAQVCGANLSQNMVCVAQPIITIKRNMDSLEDGRVFMSEPRHEVLSFPLCASQLLRNVELIHGFPWEPSCSLKSQLCTTQASVHIPDNLHI